MTSMSSLSAARNFAQLHVERSMVSAAATGLDEEDSGDQRASLEKRAL
jgi:hypothetical protein